MPPSAKVHNLVLGKTWIDSYGTFHVRNVNTGVRVEMEFKPCGWFGSGQYEFEGLVLDEQVGAEQEAFLLAHTRGHIVRLGCRVLGCRQCRLPGACVRLGSGGPARLATQAALGVPQRRRRFL